ncbi:hypothetical protein [Roseateles sp.]|uniref:hypothetical protein n=1 Tax=Roseateles sp. TaxID=1971397 RepID=UPI0031D69849
MNDKQLMACIAQAADDLGLDSWALGRRAGLPEELVSSVLSGQTQAAVETLVALAAALGLEVQLVPVQPARRIVGSVPTIVDQAVERVAPELIVHVDDDGVPRDRTPAAGPPYSKLGPQSEVGPVASPHSKNTGRKA